MSSDIIYSYTFSIRTCPSNSIVLGTSFPSYAKLHIKSLSTVILNVSRINNCCIVKASPYSIVQLFIYRDILTAFIIISSVVWFIALLYGNKHALSHACTHIHTHVYTYTHIAMCACTHTAHTYTHACMHIHTHTHTHTHTFTHTYTCMHIHMYVHKLMCFTLLPLSLS